MKQASKQFPFNCQHCSCAILRDGSTTFRCRECKSLITVPPRGGVTQKLRIGKHTLAITSDNLLSRWGKYPYSAESYYDPLLQEFSREFPFKDIFKNAKDEFAALVNLRHMIKTVWLSRRPKPAFLKKYGLWPENRLNEYWHCTHFAEMYIRSAACLGFPARVLNIARGVKISEQCAGHMVADVWSNQYQKWIFMDVHHDFHYENADGEPLDLLEVRHLYWHKKAKGLYANARNNFEPGWSPRRYHVGAEPPSDMEKALHERTLNTFWGLFFHGQNYFSRPRCDRQIRVLVYEDEMTRGKDILGGGRVHYAEEPMVMRTDDIRDIYPTMNNAEIGLYLTPQDGHGKLRAYIATVTPNLSRICYRVNKGEWEKYDVDGFAIPLGLRAVTVEAFTENLAGRKGRTSTVTIKPTKPSA